MTVLKCLELHASTSYPNGPNDIDLRLAWEVRPFSSTLRLEFSAGTGEGVVENLP